MEFGPIPVNAAKGCILAHSVAVKSGRLRKGLCLSDDDLAALREMGISQVVVAQSGHGDVHEDEAAAQLAGALVPDPSLANLTLGPAFTGRVNLIAPCPGVVKIDATAIDALNQIHPMITCATVLPFTRMETRGLVATVKIISYAVPVEALERACVAAQAAISLAPVVLKTADLIVTDTGAGPNDEKGIAAIKGRLDALGMKMGAVMSAPHTSQDIASAIVKSTSDLVLILTASATSDPNDIAPAALRSAGGHIVRFGMPVDPGNLLFVGDMEGRPVIGLPGCARSPALNGADWVLERIACGIEISSEDIAGMGVGGLLKEIPQRPQPRRG
ncbi:MAG: molybdopterin-binding protein [Litoreibacter sp.]